MKKLFTAVSIIIMAFVFVSCGSNKNINGNKNNEIKSEEAGDKNIIETENHIGNENSNVQPGEEEPKDGECEEAPKDSEGESNLEEVSNDAGDGGSSQTAAISKEEAVELVKKYMSDNGEYIPSVIMVDNEDDSQYIIHAYDIIDDGSGTSHTATSGWYYVSRATGEVTSMF